MNQRRIEFLQKKIENNSAVFIKNPANLVYLTTLTHSEGYLLITHNDFYYLTDSRYTEAAEKVINPENVVEFGKLYEIILDLLKKNKVSLLYTEPSFVSVSEFLKIENALNGIELSKSDVFEKEILKLREVKEQSEIENIMSAQKITDDGFSYILNRIKSGMTEKEIALDLEMYMRNSGSDGVSFDIVAVSGKNSSLPHGVPTDKVIENGDFLTLDFGALVNGYHSDMTRTVAVGSVSEKQREVYETVLKAQKAALSEISPHKKCSDIDKIAREIITDAGYGKNFGHALGHSVGVEIHEAPNFSPRSEAVAEIGNVITVEPGIYIPNEFGVRIEDLVVVTADGILNLTKSPKELIVL